MDISRNTSAARIIDTFLVVAALAVAGSTSALGKVDYRIAKSPWDEALGNHRAIVHVDEKAEAASVTIPWRRHDRDPEKRNIVVVSATSGERVKNVARGEITREAGTIIFEAKSAGDYYIYYAPFKPQPGWGFYSGDYTPVEATADAAWSKTKPSAEAKALAIESRLDFDQVDPMEVIATKEETAALLAKHTSDAMLVFPEDRKFPIRMNDELPLRWIDRGPTDRFEGEAAKNEFYAFQIGIFAAGADLHDVRGEFGDLKNAEGRAIGASRFNCFNTAGRNYDGDGFSRTINIEKGKIQALWFGIDLPADIEPGDYRGTMRVVASGVAPKSVEIALKVLPTMLADRGDSEPWRHSRLRWLDSLAGLDDQVVAPYMPLAPPAKKKNKAIACLGREVEYSPDGSLGQITSFGEPLLAAPLAFVVESTKGPLKFTGDKMATVLNSPGTVVLETHRASQGIQLRIQLTMQFDGHLDCRYTIVPTRDVDVKDIRLEIPLRKRVATYLMGIGAKAAFDRARINGNGKARTTASGSATSLADCTSSCAGPATTARC